MDSSSFMFKHWAVHHSDMLTAPKFVFSVISHHKDPLSRMVKEAILIVEKASLNSKSEYKGYKIARITVDKSDKEKKVEEDLEEAREAEIRKEMVGLKGRVESAKAQLKASNKTKFVDIYRKRAAAEMAESGESSKRRRFSL